MMKPPEDFILTASDGRRFVVRGWETVHHIENPAIVRIEAFVEVPE